MLTTVHYLPVGCFILLPSSFIITYIIAIWLGHVEVIFPYISDTGTKVPESCIFSQLFNIVAFLILLTILVRYKQVEQQCRDYLAPDANKVFTLNKLSLYMGILSACGLSIVANFQELQLFIIHMIGAYTAFGFSLVYCVMQTRISYHMYPIIKSGLTLARCRLALTIILGVTFVTSTVLGPIAIHYFKGKDITIWQPSDGGYLYHVISSVCEWISAISIDLFLLSFAHEFKYMSISSPKFYMISTVNSLQSEEQRSEESEYGVVNVVVNNRDNFNTSSVARTNSTRRSTTTQD